MPELTAHPYAQGTRLRLAERRQQRLQEARAKHSRLCEELEETQGRLMLQPGRWLEQCECPLVPGAPPISRAGHCRCPDWCLDLLLSPVEVDPKLEPESAEYLEALERATAGLEQCVNLCKAHVMMVTCFDISVAAVATTPGPQEVDV